MIALHDQDALKRMAALRAVDEVTDGMVLGLGTGSTVKFVLEALGGRIAKGLSIAGIPTSEKTAALAGKYGIPLTTFAEHRSVDLTIDGADEVESGTLNLIKGGGGALLREKIVAVAGARLLIVVDESKLVDRLGGKAPLPVEIVRFGWQATVDHLRDAGMMPALRMDGSQPFLTEGGNHIADCAMTDIPDAAMLGAKLASMAGVVEHGLFIGMASQVFVGGASGTIILNNGQIDKA